MRVEKLSSHFNATQALKKLGVHGGGVHVMKDKMALHFFYLYDMHVGAANILKQDALSIGAELAVPNGVITAEKPYYDAILIATTKQLKLLVEKEKLQYYGLKELSEVLKNFVSPKKADDVKIMGVVNANEDSFFKGSRFQGSAAYERVVSLIEEGADIIDIGGVSSKPGSLGVSEAEELSRVKEILDMIRHENLSKQCHFSMDSYSPKTLRYALESGFSIVNDITGLQNDEVCRIAAEHNAQVVIMHMQGSPESMQKNPHYSNVVLEVSDFFEERLEKAERFGIKKTVLDVGIGFGKTLEHNLQLIANLEHFLYLQKPLLMAASRKSLIAKLDGSAADERLAGTLALHQRSVENGASILRVHDVKEHVQMLKVLSALDA